MQADVAVGVPASMSTMKTVVVRITPLPEARNGKD